MIAAGMGLVPAAAKRDGGHGPSPCLPSPIFCDTVLKHSLKIDVVITGYLIQDT
jgi:hypothetical protein